MQSTPASSRVSNGLSRSTTSAPPVYHSTVRACTIHTHGPGARHLVDLPLELGLRVLDYGTVREFTHLRAVCTESRHFFVTCLRSQPIVDPPVTPKDLERAAADVDADALMRRFDTEQVQIRILAEARRDEWRRRKEWAYFTFHGRYDPRRSLFFTYYRTYAARLAQLYAIAADSAVTPIRCASAAPPSAPAPDSSATTFVYRAQVPRDHRTVDPTTGPPPDTSVTRRADDGDAPVFLDGIGPESYTRTPRADDVWEDERTLLVSNLRREAEFQMFPGYESDSGYGTRDAGERARALDRWPALKRLRAQDVERLPTDKRARLIARSERTRLVSEVFLRRLCSGLP
jgi:hypothetical protein